MCRVNNLDDSLVDGLIDDMKQKTWASSEDLAGYEGLMKGTLHNMSPEELKSWADKQVYIALGNIMTWLATMRIDACPMEWFISEKYDEVLGLTEKGLSSVLVLPVGFRHEDDPYAQRPKIRYSEDYLISHI